MNRPELTTAARASASSVRTPIAMGPVIKAARNKKGFSQQKLADLMGVSRMNVTNWEADRYKPEFDLIPSLCRMLDISVDDLFGTDTGTSLDLRERNLLNCFRSLGEANKNVLIKTAQAMQEEETLVLDEQFKCQHMMLDDYDQGLAAGSGCEEGEMRPGYAFVKKTKVNEKADSIFYVTGDSMLPVYHDGDRVYVESMKHVSPGADAVFFGAEGFFIKRVGPDGRPYSLNKAYPFHTDDWNRLSIQGKVLGIVDPRDIPNRMDESLLSELYADEIRDFYMQHPDSWDC